MQFVRPRPASNGMEIRNIAIIAHVDHGKTTLTDALMRQTGMVTDASVSMDSNALEQERGITIYAKNAAIFYPPRLGEAGSPTSETSEGRRKTTKINIVDTPGHADFGSEVERVLRSIDSVVLVVDAQEGPMPQTRFVLKKSLELGLRPIVVLNKIDKPAAKTDTESPLRVQPFNLGYDNFVGRLAVARVYEGKLKVNDAILMRNKEGKNEAGRVVKLFTFRGLERVETNEVEAGDIVMIAGLANVEIGDTICFSSEQELLPAIAIDEPKISLNFVVNDSPFAGREGKYVTNKQLRERLKKELEINVGLRIDFSDDHYKVYGRGELHVAILLENMRREGYEVQVSQPQVIIKEVGGVKSEPFEEVTVECPLEVSGTVIEKMGKRKGIMMEMKEGSGGGTRPLFQGPTRRPFGYRGGFMIDTRGEGTLYTRVLDFRPFVGVIKKRDEGSMVSMATGKALAFSLNNLQARGTLYIGPSTEV